MSGVERAAAVLSEQRWRPEFTDSAHNAHTFDAWCAICSGDVEAIVLALDDANLIAQPTADEAEGDERARQASSVMLNNLHERALRAEARIEAARKVERP